MRPTDRLLALLPNRVRTLLLAQREAVKFLVVGGACYLLTVAVNYALKLTVLTSKPTTALGIATVIASVASYIANREWSFRTRGGRRRHHEAALFLLFSAIAVVVNVIPLWVSRYIFDLQVPAVSRLTQEIADFLSGMILGTLLAMVFRLWAFRRWVFPTADIRSRHAVPVSAGTPVPGGTTPPPVLEHRVMPAPASTRPALRRRGPRADERPGRGGVRSSSGAAEPDRAAS